MELHVLWAAIALWLCAIWVSLGHAVVSKKSVEALGKNPELSWSLMVFTVLGIALVESAAIYGLIIAFKIIDLGSAISVASALSAGLVMGIAGLPVSLWEWWVVAAAIDALQRNPEAKNKIMTFMVLFVALVESSAIYALIVAFKILW